MRRFSLVLFALAVSFKWGTACTQPTADPGGTCTWDSSFSLACQETACTEGYTCSDWDSTCHAVTPPGDDDPAPAPTHPGWHSPESTFHTDAAAERDAEADADAEDGGDA